MFIYENTNVLTEERYKITAPNLLEILGQVLEYYNGVTPNDKDYLVIMLDKNYKTVLEVSEAGIWYALSGEVNGYVSDDKLQTIKDECGKFWHTKHSDIEVIEFYNPVRKGNAVWNEEGDEDEYEDEEDDQQEDDQQEDDQEVNIIN